jgi:pimeloyl-ACP methyl ester carboxylesterase
VFPTPDLAAHAECAEKNRVLVARTRRRRAEWPSPAAYAAALEGRGPFAAFAPGQLRRVADATLEPVAGGFRLACAPAVEAAVFENFGRPVVFPDLAGIASPIPLHLVSGDPDVGPGRDWVTAMMADVARALRPASFTTLPGRGHLVPFEAPAQTLSLVRDLI